MRTLILVVIMLIAPVTSAVADDNYFVLTYTPGKNWVSGTSYEEQADIQGHLDYLDRLFEERRLVMGGRYRDRPLGLMIFRGDSLAEAQAVAENDPGVIAGIVDVTVNIWDVRMSGMRWTKSRPPPVVQDPDEPWHLKRIDPSGPVNLEKRD